MSKYLKITNDVVDLRVPFSIDLMYIEIDNHGKVLREIGFDSLGNIIHKYPSNTHHYGNHGIFDLNIFDIESFENGIDKEDFEIFWDKENHSTVYNRLYPQIVNSHQLKDIMKQILIKELCSINDIDLGALTCISDDKKFSLTINNADDAEIILCIIVWDNGDAEINTSFGFIEYFFFREDESYVAFRKYLTTQVLPVFENY
ncbi:hypothetical protein [Cellulophaga sp. BC115SP]|uniref:hypothetical protein n=1 Tax=Cellulophaga sp. BC115SP TaxID=2683263 RepID=UPI00141346E7|nr:hypothetical protein [Cellulophaga sp. BC115SP]NBB30076.1 hypothetical protein [Cellulophaga sp. BC115SP]